MTDKTEQPEMGARDKRFHADTLIVPARVESFHDVFVSEQAWYPIRIDDRRKSALKWICVYQNSPVRAITHYAKIIRIENHKQSGCYRLLFEKPIELPAPIALGSEPRLTMQGQKYTSLERVLRARVISDLRPWNQ
jgi:hypothetical protein